MICEDIKRIKRYCSDYEQIENYQEAVSSPEKYDCHHRLEDTGLSKKDLIDRDMYYNRPHEELIFMTHSAHISLHNKGKNHSAETKKKMSDSKKGKLHSAETKKKISDSKKGKHHSIETKNKMSNSKKGENNPRYKHICPALLQMMYIEQRKSANKISQELGISRKVIISRLRELNIPIRKR